MEAQTIEEGRLSDTLDEVIFTRLFPSGSVCTWKINRNTRKGEKANKNGELFPSPPF
jgi:hypothetical protein